MQLISSKEAVDFLSQAAPRPWVRRLLRWMAFNEELKAYSTSGEITAFTSVSSFTFDLYSKVKEFSGPKMDEAIKNHYSPEFAEKLIGKEYLEKIFDEPCSWTEKEEPRFIDIGFFLYASEIDFDLGNLTCDWLQPGSGIDEFLFPDEELFGSTDFENPEFTAKINGISFEFGGIEMLLPNLNLKKSSSYFAETVDSKRHIGRPRKWDWEGAIAFIVSEAQTPDGLPTGAGAQARIEEMMASWFETEVGNSPSVSQIRTRAAKIMKMIITSK